MSFPPLGGMTQEPYCQHGGDENWPTENWRMLAGVTNAGGKGEEEIREQDLVDLMMETRAGEIQKYAIEENIPEYQAAEELI